MYKFFLLIGLFFIGCAYKIHYTSSTPYYVVIKNSSISMADTGFIKRDKSRFNLQLFSASTPIFNLHVDDDVCLDYVCLSQQNFNKKFFGINHYKGFIDELFNFKPIYGKKNLKKNKNSFEQKLKTDSYDITYRVEEGRLYFRDSKNRVLIKLKELK